MPPPAPGCRRWRSWPWPHSPPSSTSPVSRQSACPCPWPTRACRSGSSWWPAPGGRTGCLRVASQLEQSDPWAGRYPVPGLTAGLRSTSELGAPLHSWPSGPARYCAGRRARRVWDPPPALRARHSHGCPHGSGTGGMPGRRREVRSRAASRAAASGQASTVSPRAMASSMARRSASSCSATSSSSAITPSRSVAS